MEKRKILGQPDFQKWFLTSFLQIHSDQNTNNDKNDNNINNNNQTKKQTESTEGAHSESVLQRSISSEIDFRRQSPDEFLEIWNYFLFLSTKPSQDNPNFNEKNLTQFWIPALEHLIAHLHCLRLSHQSEQNPQKYFQDIERIDEIYCSIIEFILRMLEDSISNLKLKLLDLIFLIESPPEPNSSASNKQHKADISMLNFPLFTNTEERFQWTEGFKSPQSISLDHVESNSHLLHYEKQTQYPARLFQILRSILNQSAINADQKKTYVSSLISLLSSCPYFFFSDFDPSSSPSTLVHLWDFFQGEFKNLSSTLPTPNVNEHSTITTTSSMAQSQDNDYCFGNLFDSDPRGSQLQASLEPAFLTPILVDGFFSLNIFLFHPQVTAPWLKEVLGDQVFIESLCNVVSEFDITVTPPQSVKLWRTFISRLVSCEGFTPDHGLNIWKSLLTKGLLTHEACVLLVHIILTLKGSTNIPSLIWDHFLSLWKSSNSEKTEDKKENLQEKKEEKKEDKKENEKQSVQKKKEHTQETETGNQSKKPTRTQEIQLSHIYLLILSFYQIPLESRDFISDGLFSLLKDKSSSLRPDKSIQIWISLQSFLLSNHRSCSLSFLAFLKNYFFYPWLISLSLNLCLPMPSLASTPKSIQEKFLTDEKSYLQLINLINMKYDPAFSFEDFQGYFSVSWEFLLLFSLPKTMDLKDKHLYEEPSNQSLFYLFLLFDFLDTQKDISEKDIQRIYDNSLSLFEKYLKDIYKLAQQYSDFKLFGFIDMNLKVLEKTLKRHNQISEQVITDLLELVFRLCHILNEELNRQFQELVQKSPVKDASLLKHLAPVPKAAETFLSNLGCDSSILERITHFAYPEIQSRNENVKTRSVLFPSVASQSGQSGRLLETHHLFLSLIRFQCQVAQISSHQLSPKKLWSKYSSDLCRWRCDWLISGAHRDLSHLLQGVGLSDEEQSPVSELLAYLAQHRGLFEDKDQALLLDKIILSAINNASVPFGHLISLLSFNNSPQINQTIFDKISAKDNLPQVAQAVGVLFQDSPEVLNRLFILKLLGEDAQATLKVSSSSTAETDLPFLQHTINWLRQLIASEPKLITPVLDCLLKVFSSKFLTLPSAQFLTFLCQLATEHNRVESLLRTTLDLLKQHTQNTTSSSSKAEKESESPSTLAYMTPCFTLIDFVHLLLQKSHKLLNPEPSDDSATQTSEDEGLFGYVAAEDPSLLDTKLCTFTLSKTEYMEQPWYTCQTCGLVGSSGCCSICAQVCHRDHDVCFAKVSRFYCDCASQKGKKCACLKERTSKTSPPPKKNNIRDMLIKKSSDPENIFSSGSNLFEGSDIIAEKKMDSLNEVMKNYQVPEEEINQVLNKVKDELVSILFQLQVQLTKIASEHQETQPVFQFDLPSETHIQSKSDILSFKRALKVDSFDVRGKFNSPEVREFRSRLFSQTFQYSACVLASNSRNKLAIGEGQSIRMFEVPKLFEEGSILDKHSIRTLSQISVGFEVFKIAFNPAYENFLAVASLKQCKVITLNSALKATHQLELNLILDQKANGLIHQIMWLPKSETCLAVVTQKNVKIYDLAKDSISPLYYFTLPEDSFKEITFIREENITTLVALSTSGALYTQELFEIKNNDGSLILTNVLSGLPKNKKAGCTVHYSSATKLLFCSFLDGSCFVGKLNSNKTGFVNTVSLSTENLKNHSNQSLWTEFPRNEVPGVVSFWSSKSNACVLLNLKDNTISAQVFKPPCKSGTKLLGLTTLGATRKSLVVLMEDGSLHRFDLNRQPSEKVQPTKGLPLQDDSVFLKFPRLFFEKVENITPKIELRGPDILQNYSSDVAKQRLATNEGYLVSPSSNSFKITVYNPYYKETVMVGIRFLVGQSSIENIPSYFQIFNRQVPVAGSQQRRWVEIPFTTQEALTADREFTVVAHDPPSENIILDSMEVYGLSKTAFQWSKRTKTAKTLKKAVRGSAGPLENQLDNVLNALFLAMNQSTVDQKLKGDIIHQLAPLLNQKDKFVSLKPAIKQLLLGLTQNNQTSYHAIKDNIQLAYMEKLLSSSEMDEENYPGFVETLKTAAIHRKNNLFEFLTSHKDFLQQFFDYFWTQIGQNATIFGTSLPKILSGLAKILFGYGELCCAIRKPLDLFFEMLDRFYRSGSEYIRVMFANEFNQLIKATELSGSGQKKAMEQIKYKIVCDVCQTQIVDKRWTCNVCPDYDICHNCHLGAPTASPKLTPPHTAAHAVSETSDTPLDLQRSTLETLLPQDLDLDDDEQLMALAYEMSMATLNDPPPSKPFIKISSEVRETFHNQLLSQLLNTANDLNQLHDIAPVKLVPVAQTIHASLRCLPESTVLKLFPQWIGKILFSKKELGSSASEIQESIVWVMLLSLLLNEKQSNKLTSLASELTKILRTEQVERFLFGTLKGLLGVFEKQEGNAQEGVASEGTTLLMPTHYELPSTAYSPFFSSSSFKEHLPNGLFSSYHRLLTEFLFKLMWAIHRPERGEGQKLTSPNQSLFAESWKPLLCDWINCDSASFIIELTKKLLLALCKSKPQYYSLRDSSLLQIRFQTLLQYSTETDNFTKLNYNQNVDVLEGLNKLYAVASLRPYNWQQFCFSNEKMLQLIFDLTVQLSEETAGVALKLLALAFSNFENLKVKTGNAPLHFSSESSPVPEHRENEKEELALREKKEQKRRNDQNEISQLVIELEKQMPTRVPLILKHPDRLARLTDLFLLDFPSSATRKEVSALLIGLWNYSNLSQQNELLEILTSKVELLPNYGKNAKEFFQVLLHILGQFDAQKHAVDNLKRFVKAFVQIVKDQNRLMDTHPNSFVYRALPRFVDFSGYYLESEPCLICNETDTQAGLHKLETLRVDTKFTDSTQVIKLNSTYEIHSFSFHMSETKKAKRVKTIKLYHASKPIKDLSDEQHQLKIWKLVKTLNLTPTTAEMKVEFPIPIITGGLMIEYADFYENTQALNAEKITCPRCKFPVNDKTCPQCRENVYQCRQCRNINYDNPDAFLCNDCGHCKWARFEFLVMARASFSSQHIQDDQDRERAIDTIKRESETANSKYQQLITLQKPLNQLVGILLKGGPRASDIGNLSASRANQTVALVSSLYEKECKSCFDGLTKSIQTLQSTRQELVKYSQKHLSVTALANSTAKKTPRATSAKPKHCFGCASSFVCLSLEVLERLAQHGPGTRQIMVEAGILSELMAHNLDLSSIFSPNVTTSVDVTEVLCKLTQDDSESLAILHKIINEKLEYAFAHFESIDFYSFLTNEIRVLTESCYVVDSIWDQRLKIVMDLFFRSIAFGWQIPVVCDTIILPLLVVLKDLSGLPNEVLTETSTVNIQPAAPKQPKQSTTPKPTRDKVEPTEVSLKSPSLKHNLNNNNLSNNLSLLTDNVLNSEIEETEEWGPSSQKSEVPRYKVQMEAEPTITYQQWASQDEGAMRFQQWNDRYEESLISVVVTDTSEVAPAESRETYLAKKYLKKWRQFVQLKKTQRTSSVTLDKLLEPEWFQKILFNPCSASIRSHTAELVNSFCQLSPSRMFILVDLLYNNFLPLTLGLNNTSLNFFEIFQNIISQPQMKAYLTVKGFLKAICQLITKEIERIQDMESMFSHDLSQGYVLKMYLQLLDSFLKNENIRHKFKKDHLMEKILHGFLVLRGVIVQKTQLVEESIQMLSNILDAVTSDSESDNKVFISACIKSLNQIASNSQDLVNRPEIQFIFERLTKIICPKQEEPTIFLILNKSPTQEEFIRGSMTKNPYPSTEIGGPLMRDVKNKICSTLGMPHLLEDDNSIELLVMNKIIKLDLSIKKVYQYVIKGTDFSQPMVITYRLQGLDGEATEEIVDHVVEEDQTKDPEEEFKLGAALAECNGLESVLQVVDSITDFEMQHHLAEVVLNFLWHLSLLKANRAQLVGLNGIQVLLSKLVLAFECETRPRLAELLLLTIENLVKEQNNMNVISHNIKIDTASQQMKLFLDKLSSHIMGENSSIFNTVSRILPFLCYGERPIIEILSNYFFKYLDFGEFDKNQKEENEDKTQELHLKCFRVLCENITRDTNGHLLKSIFVIQKITERLMGYLVEKFRDNTSNEEAWEKAIHLPSVPYVLGALSGLAAKHENTQKMFLEKKLIDCLHKLEKTTAVQSVGNYSENLLNNLLAADVPEVKQAVEDIRTQTQKAQMDKAKKHREKMLQKLNLKADPKNNNAKPAIPTGFNLDEVQDETGLTCMVCQEGYTFRPKEPLGFYTFSKMNLLELANTEQQKRSRPEHGFTTVTHFNLIHITCHQQAVAAEKHMKNRPKNEWEGAIIRNQHTNCNNLFPIQGPSTPIEVYQLGVDRYWSTLNSTVVRLETSQFRLLLHDMKFLLLYFAKEESLATHSHGGGKESNLKFIPFLVQMGLHLLDSPKKPTREDRTHWSSILVKYLEQEVESPISSDDVLFMLCLSIFIQTSEEWEDSKMKFLKRLIHFCRFYQGKENEKSGKEPPTVYEPTVARIRFGFIFMILVDRLHKIFKKASGQKASNTFQHAASEKWLIDMKAAITNDHLQAIDSMAKLLKEYESEILSLVDLQEFLDELGLLSAIYQEEKDESQFVLNILKADPPSVQSSKEEKE